MTEDNIYTAPAAELEVEDTDQAPFYIVSTTKFLSLYLATLGIYGIYWFYRHWRHYKLYLQSDIWPIPRAIFSIFFAHSLFELFDSKAVEQGAAQKWYPALLATIYVVFEITGNLVERLDKFGIGEPLISIVSFGSMFVVAAVLYRAQQVANQACGDPDGSSNANFTLANIIWLIIGAILWILINISIFSMMGLIDFEI